MHFHSNVIVAKTPHEYIRVHTSDIRIHTSNIRVHSRYIRLHTGTYGNMKVTYEYIGYIQMHRSNIRWQKGNKHEMYHFLFTFHFYRCTGPVLHTYVSARKCHKRVRTTHMDTYAIRAPHPHKTNLSVDVT